MINLFDSGISIEKMAAFLDGNLSASEMQDISSLIESNASLQQFMNVNSMIEESISALSSSDMELLQELQTQDFQLPSLDDNFHGLVTLSPEASPFEESMPASACDDEQPEDTSVQQFEPKDHGDITESFDGTEVHTTTFTIEDNSPQTENAIDALGEGF